MKVLLDNNLSPFVADAINVLVEPNGHQVTALRRKFAEDTLDEKWIAALSDEGGWVVISRDRRITRNPAQRAAWRSSRLKGFFLAPAWDDLDTLRLAARLLLRWPNLVEADRLFAEGSAIQVPIRGRLRQLPL